MDFSLGRNSKKAFVIRVRNTRVDVVRKAGAVGDRISFKQKGEFLADVIPNIFKRVQPSPIVVFNSSNEDILPIGDHRIMEESRVSVADLKPIFTRFLPPDELSSFEPFIENDVNFLNTSYIKKRWLASLKKNNLIFELLNFDIIEAKNFPVS